MTLQGLQGASNNNLKSNQLSSVQMASGSKRKENSSCKRKWGIVAVVGTLAMVAIAALSNPTVVPKPIVQIGGVDFDLNETCIKMATNSAGLVETRNLGWQRITALKREEVLEVNIDRSKGSGEKRKAVRSVVQDKNVDVYCSIKVTQATVDRFWDSAVYGTNFNTLKFDIKGMDIDAWVQIYSDLT